MTTTSAVTTNATRRKQAFSLIEVTMALAISSMVLAGVFSALIFFVRSGIALENYHDMEGRYQRMLMQFSRDTWMATDAKWPNPVTLRLQTPTGPVEYKFLSADGTLTRGDSSGTAVVLQDIESLQFKAFDQGGNEISLQNDLTNANTATKSAQLIILASKAVPLGWTNDASMSTARVMMRNKLVH